jgi:PAS domain S-box-containing protein
MYNAILNVNPLPTLVYDCETLMVIDVNKAAIKFFGFSKDEFAKLTLKDLMSIKELKRLTKAHSDNNGEEKLIHSKILVQQKRNGKPLQLEIHGQEINFNSRKSVLMVCQEVKDKNEEIDKLRNREQRLNSLIQGSFDLVGIIDKEGFYTYMSPASKAITGIEPEEFIGKNAFDFIHPDDAERVLASLKKVKTTGREVIEAFRAKDRKDEWRWLETVLTNQLDHPAVNGIVVNTRDITKQLEEKQELKLFESVITNTKDAVLITEAEPVDKPGPKIIYVNKAFSEMTGYSAKEIIGKTPRILQGPDSDYEELSKLGQSLRKWEPYEITTINYKKNGEPFWINFTVNPVANEKGWYTHWIAIERDVTKSKQVEENLRKAKEKAEKNEYAMSQASKLAKIGYWDHNFETNELNCTDYIYDLYGLNPENVVLTHEKAKTYFDKPSQDKITRATKELIDKGKSYDLELRMINANNEEFYIRKIIEPVYNDNDKIVGKRGVIQNITEEKHLQNLNRDVARMVKIGSWSVNLEKETVFWSKEVHDIHETDSNSYVPNLEQGINFYREDFRKLIKSEIENTIRTGNGWDFEAVIVTAKQNEVWIRSIGHAEFVNGKCVRLYGGFQDINTRKQSENRLISLSQNLPGVVYQYHIYPDGTDALKSISGKVEEIWGFTAEELMENMSLAWKQIEAGGRIEEVKASILQSIENKSKWQCQIKYVMPKTGQHRTHLGFGTPSFLSDGTIIFNSIVLDITEQARNKVLLEQTNKAARIGSWEMDLIGNEKDSMYWSPMVKEILELSDDYNPTLTGGIEFYVEESKQQLEKAINLLITDGIEFDLELLLTTAKYNKLWVRTIGSCEVNNNKPIKIFGSLQDINEKKLAEIELKESLRALKDYKYSLDQSAIIAFTDEKAVFTSVNDNYCKISGYSRQELLGQTYQLIDSKHHPKEFFIDLWKTVKSGNVWRGEIKNKAKDGTYYWVDSTVVPFLNDKNKPIKYLTIQFNISNRKSAEEQLVIAAERLSLAKTSAKMGIWDWDVVNDILTWDDKMYDLYGTKKEDFDAAVSAWESGLHPDDKEKAIEDLNDALEGKTDFNTVFRVVWPDSSVHYIQGQAIVSRDEKGNPVRMIGSNFDITDRKMAENQILLANERFEKVTEATNDAIWDWDIANDRFYRSKAIENFFGKSTAKSFTNKDLWKDKFHSEDIDTIIKSVDEALENPDIFKWKQEYRVFNDKDEMLYVIDKGVIIRNDQGKAIRMVGAMTDITDQKKSEEQNRFKANLLRTIGQAAIGTDINGIVNYWNRAAEIIYGWSRDDAFGKNIDLLVPSEVNQDQKKEMSTLLETGKTWSGEYIVQKKDGSKFPVRVSKSPVYDESNDLTGIISISSDITQEVESKELLKQYTADLERYNEKLRKIAWTQSHVVRAPLARILGIINLIELQEGKLDDLLTWIEQLKISSMEMDEIVKKIVEEANQLNIE